MAKIPKTKPRPPPRRESPVFETGWWVPGRGPLVDSEPSTSCSSSSSSSAAPPTPTPLRAPRKIPVDRDATINDNDDDHDHDDSSTSNPSESSNETLLDLAPFILRTPTTIRPRTDPHHPARPSDAVLAATHKTLTWMGRNIQLFERALHRPETVLHGQEFLDAWAADETAMAEGVGVVGGESGKMKGEGGAGMQKTKGRSAASAARTASALAGERNRRGEGTPAEGTRSRTGASAGGGGGGSQAGKGKGKGKGERTGRKKAPPPALKRAKGGKHPYTPGLMGGAG